LVISLSDRFLYRWIASFLRIAIQIKQKGGIYMRGMWDVLKRLAADETGLSTVEVLLILVCLITLVIIFREEMIDIVESVFDEITKKIKKIT
jgi:Flp pilus assembly pilin Flp